MNTVVVFEALTEFDATSIADLLLESGIPSLVRPQHVAGLDLSLGMGRNVWALVEVDELQAEKAREIIGGFLGSLGMLAEADLEAQALEAEDDSTAEPL